VIQLVSGYSLSFSLLRAGTSVYVPGGGITLPVIIIIILLLLLTLLSSFESAYLSITQDDLDRLRSGKRRNSGTLLRLLTGTGEISGTLYIINLIIIIIIILLAVKTGSRIIDPAACGPGCFLAGGLIIFILILFSGKLLPGLFTHAFKLSLALLIAPAVSVLGKIFSPVNSLFKSETADTRKRSASSRQGITLDELSDVFEQTGDDFNDDEKILEGIVNFGNINVSTIMCPRIDVTAIDMRSGLNQVIQLIISTGFSRIPAYSETFDNVKGILYAKDILPFMSNPDNFKWQSLLREPYFVPETKRISDLLKEFQIKKIHMAVVIDEYGGTAGIVTLEDILEEIVGEITDESDDDKVPYRKIDDHNYVFEGRILLNDIIKILNLGADPFEEVRGESETLAGLILEITGEIPVQKQVVKYKNFTFTIESADRRRIKEVHVEINNDNDKT